MSPNRTKLNRNSVFSGLVLLFCLCSNFSYAASDITPPTGSIKINNNATYATSIQVTLNLSAQDNAGGSGISQMKFSNNNSTWSTAEAYATTKNWTLTTGDGTKTVYVRFKDVAGNWSATYSDAIILDTTLPSTTISGIDGLWKKASIKVTLTASDSGSGIDKIYYSIDGSNPSIIYTAPFIISNEGIYTPKYYSKDKAGNVESTKTSSKQAKIDITPPQGSIKINNDDAYTTSTSVTLTLSAQDALSGVSQMQFSNNNSTWSTAEAYNTVKSWTLTSGAGTKTVYVKFKDNTGNWSSAVSDTIIFTLDILSISINPKLWDIGSTQVNSVVTMTQANKITVTNNGTGPETFALSLTNPSGWTASTSQGADTYVLSGLFCNSTDVPQPASFNQEGSGGDVVLPLLKKATSTIFGYAQATANGVSVPAGAARSLYLQFKSPTVTDETTEQNISVIVNCQTP